MHCKLKIVSNIRWLNIIQKNDSCLAQGLLFYESNKRQKFEQGVKEMEKKSRQERRSRLGYGSSYRKGRGQDLGAESGIGTVLGGQVWMVKPDKRAETANPCIWMQAGVVEFKNCNNFGDCTTCKYDLGMRKKVDQGRQISWQDAMRTREGLDRICRHSLTHRIEKRVPMGYYYHDGHTWARIESGGYIRVGMDDFSLKLLGSPDALDLPLMGKELDKDKVGWGLKRNDNLADVRSPVGGVIVEVNSKVRERAKLARERPFEDGWLFVLRNPEIKGTIKDLMSDTDSMGWMNDEVNKLENMIEQVAGPMAVDGGHLSGDIFGSLPQLGWKNLTKTFLKT
jgi:glycine cleavage system H lipoate-binding protein